MIFQKRTSQIKSFIKLIFIILTVCILLTGCTLGAQNETAASGTAGSDSTPTNNSTTDAPSSPTGTDNADSSPTATPGNEYQEVSILSVGDILVHSTQLTAQYNKETDTYDFTNNFRHVAPYISKADYAVANLETTLAGNEWRDYEGYPSFNTPDSMAEALKGAGFDMILTSNNHIYDSRDKGFFRTGEVLRQMNFDVLGTRLNENEKKYFVKDIKGIKVGFINYGYETVRQNGKKCLNGDPLSDAVAPLVDTFDYNNKQDFYDEVEQSINAMKNEGAEFFVAYIHWGKEYKTTQNSHQEEIAQALCELGIDVIIGGHPHVLQPADVLKSEDTGKTTFCIYSTGNFISNQRIEFMDIKTGHTEDGIMVILNIRKYNDGRVELGSVDYIPTWVNCFKENSKRVYEIVPLPEAYNRPEEFLLNKLSDGVKSAKNSLQRTKEIIEKNINKIIEFIPFNLKVE